jgi:hypothetical protein
VLAIGKRHPEGRSDALLEELEREDRERWDVRATPR